VPAEPDPSVVAQIRSGEVDALTFTSSSTVNNFVDAIGEITGPRPLVVSIGPVTSAAARESGLRVDAEADPHTIDGLVTAVTEAFVH
jgi:uroporphyrinogen III methyltransferase/synthase